MTALSRLVDGYYNSQPVSVSNPGGLAADGHVVNFPAACEDIGEVATTVGADAQATAADRVQTGTDRATAVAAAASATASAAAAAATLAGALEKSQNLADLPNKNTSRNNLQLGTGHAVSFASVTVSADPSADMHLATKKYVDAVAIGLDWKPSVRTTPANSQVVDIANPATSTFGGLVCSAGDRILLRAQTPSADNGIYIFNGPSSAMTRAVDCAHWSQVPGACVVVEEGSSADRGYVCTANQGGTIGVTAMPWTIFMGPGAYQASSTALSNFAALSFANNKLAYATGADTFALCDLTSLGRDILAAADGAAARAVIGAGQGYLGVPQNVQNAAYTLVLGDQGKHLYHSDATPRTWTIPPNADAAFPVETAVVLVNDGAAAVTVTPGAGVTLVMAGTGSTGARTLAQYGVASLLKVGTNRWIISGSGLS